MQALMHWKFVKCYQKQIGDKKMTVNIECELIECVFKHYQSYFRDNGSDILLLDPNDNKVIGFHYGETHLAASLIIYGYEIGKESYIAQGKSILKGFMNNIGLYIKEPAYHWDFNNFALCVLYEYLKDKKIEKELQELIEKFVLLQKDSNNPTINWLPMRIFVNYYKYEWSKDEKYLKATEKLKKNIKEAQYDDGFFEDLLPKGSSFNFQYHIFTTAMLMFLNLRGISIVDLDKAVIQVRKLMDPQGDVNYLGRGINQIFAWGPVMYLFNITQSKEYSTALKYLHKNSINAIQNNNLIMNEQLGENKNWWWDYHYASVYHAHFVFWMVLNFIEKRKLSVKKVDIAESDSGVHMYANEKFFICSFDGRKHYLAEYGKLITNICSKSEGYLFKGAFGPYPGGKRTYGDRYAVPNNTLHNYFGPIIEKVTPFGALNIRPVFPKEIVVSIQGAYTSIKYILKKKINSICFNVPFHGEYRSIRILDDKNQELFLKEYALFKGPYGDINIFQTENVSTQEFTVILE